MLYLKQLFPLVEMWDGGREGHELILLQQVGAHLQRHRRVHQSGSEKIF